MTELERLRALARYEAVFAAPDFTIGRWVTSEPDEQGVVQMPWFEYSEAADAFRADVGAHGWIVVFDWMTWLSSPDGRRYLEDPRFVAQAPVDDLAKLLTAIIRGDRFSEGELAGAYESGMLLAIVRRAGELAEAS
jgi:hypothetical protein